MADQQHGERCPKAPRGEHKYEDVILAADNGKLYYLRREDYIRPENELTAENCGHCYDRAMDLLKQGVALGWIRPRPGNQACYLVNLASLRRVTPFEPATWKQEGPDPMQDLLAASEWADQAATHATAAALARELGEPGEALIAAKQTLHAAEQSAKDAQAAIEHLVAGDKGK